MAKVKQTKTVQELLQEAIIPNNQAPFSIPDNWCWVKLSMVCKLDKGKKQQAGVLPYLEAKYLRGKIDASKKTEGVLLRLGDNVILVDGENSGEVFEINEDGYMGSTFKILKIRPEINEKIVLYFIESHRDELRNNKVGSAIPHLNKELFFSLPIPLAPQEEQQRIVDKIESLFSKLDEAKELIQKSLDEFENRKAAILHKAFNNEINSGGLYSSNWKRGTLRDVVLNIKYGTSEKSDYNFTGIPVVRIPNIINNQVNTCDIKYLQTSNFDNVDELADGDILIIRSNGSRDLVGQCALVEGLIGYTYASFLIRIRLKEGFEPKYVVYYLNSNAARGQLFSKAKSSAGIHNINSKEILSITIKYPPVEEQQEIVRILDSFFEKEDKSNELLDMIDQIEEMKKSILSRAFRGELGTHSDDDEPAIELLKKII